MSFKAYIINLWQGLRGKKVNYFSISFAYKGRKCNFPIDEDHDPSLKLLAAEKAVEKLFETLKIDFLHEYSWPDGSLYKYVRTELDSETLKSKLCSQLSNYPELVSIYINEVNPNTNPWKHGYSTVKKYFENP